jgi:hypothetical protein
MQPATRRREGKKTKPRGLSFVRGGRGVAGVALLVALFTYAVHKGLRIECSAWHRDVRWPTLA